MASSITQLALPVGIAQGGTGATTATTAFNALAPCSTQGDIAYHNGTNWVCLATGTSGQFLKTAGAAANPAWDNTGYSIFAAHGAWSPADGITYYWAGVSVGGPSTTQGIERVGVPKTGTITRIEVTGLIVTTNGSNETSTMTLQVNGTDQATLFNNTKQWNQGTATRIEYSLTGLSVAVSAGDHIEFKEVEPSYGTNPVNIAQSAQIFIQVP